MSWLELAAYPALVVAFYGAYRVGRGRGSLDDRFEWVRVGVLALLLGVLMAVQWTLISSGVVRSTVGLTMGVAGLVCSTALVGLHLIDYSDRKAKKDAASPAR